ncbi:MAG TPA: membrane protein insertase YidC [Desulfobacteraceae bacterium]|nr:membrane protein insertase YidC [Desulfobacteraceae bacterium]
MEQRRLFMAIALSVLVFLLWELFFVDKKTIQQGTENNRVIEVAKENLSQTSIAQVRSNLTEQILKKNKEITDSAFKPAKSITVNTPLYKLKISEAGAAFESFVLKEYREKVESQSPLLEMVSANLRGGALQVGFADNGIPGIEDAIFSAELSSGFVEIRNAPMKISFLWESPEGIIVEKRYLFSPETYLIGLDIIITNNSKRILDDNLILSLQNTPPKGGGSLGFEGPSALINNKLEQIKLKKIAKNDTYTGSIAWIALQDRYFMSSIIPTEPEQASMLLFLETEKKLKAVYMHPRTMISPGVRHVYGYNLFFGPKSMRILKKFDLDLDKAIHFGMFDFLAKPCVMVMNFLYGLTPNYGLAIIILTLLIKLILWPLGSKSYKSMAEMKRLQPLMAEIREKYKHDKQKMNMEVMGLYKTYKVNPLGGCLPMLVQIPIFFALYRMLYEAIELRHAPFFGWINDLSAPDRLLHFGFSIPFMQPPCGIPVLTIIMGGTMFLQQKMAPPMGGDPIQAKLMTFMPIMFTVIFINFSSGLVLYWLINNIVSISQQYYIQKKYV